MKAMDNSPEAKVLGLLLALGGIPTKACEIATAGRSSTILQQLLQIVCTVGG
jgi:hypothetical protein